MADAAQPTSLETDRQAKRWLWLLSAFSPSVAGIAAFAFLLTGNALWALFAPLFYYGLIPLLDGLFGEDPFNPPEGDVEELSLDQWYRALLFVAIPMVWASLVMCAIAATTPGLPFFAFVGFALSSAIVTGGAITVGHELGHKPNRLDQWGAKLANAASGYGHFCIEHNRGHHLLVATPDDPASARYGESVWAFATREIPGTFSRGWELERERLAKKGLSFWNWRNDVLQGYAITLAATTVLFVFLGWKALPFMAINCLVGWLHLTFANYVEHYGLKRERRADGKWMPCEPRHSWNTNHIVSNLMLFHLQRHSDHHSNPLRPYQALRNFRDLPSLPSGYPGTFVLALIPPVWFRVMNPKVLAWAGGDMSKVNQG
jgi:alkane 1-monooxygenase